MTHTQRFTGTAIQVPHAQKDEAKRLGARWDATRKTWYVPHGIQLTAFERWLATSQSADVMLAAAKKANGRKAGH